MQCKLRYSGGSTGGTPEEATVGCSSGYQMVGCAGWHMHNSVSSMFISTDDICYARAVTSTVYATAVWYVFILIHRIDI